jgi:hypothetical protein
VLARYAVALLLLVWSSLSVSQGRRDIESRRVAIDVTRMGVRGDGATVVGPKITSIMADHPSASIYFPAGDYLLSNNGKERDGLIVDSHFHGSLVFGVGARFLCTTSSTSAGTCVYLLGASGLSLKNVHIGYKGSPHLPLKRSDATNYTLLIDASHGVTLTNMIIEGSPGACVWLSNSSELTIDGIHVNNCSADGVHFENDKEAYLNDMWSRNTYDDGLAFTNASQKDPNCGSTAQNIHISKSAARGISVPGGCAVRVSNFEISETGSSGILVETDKTFHTRRPVDITFSKGVVSGAGALISSSGGGNKFGIEVNAADHVSFQDIIVNSSQTRGFDVSHGSTFVTLANSTIRQSGDAAIALLNSSSITLVNDVIERAGGYGTYAAGVSALNGTSLSYKNVSMRSGPANLHRVFWVDNAVGSTHVEHLSVIDDQPIATGYLIGCSRVAPYPFLLSGVKSSIRGRRLMIDCEGDVRLSPSE